MFEIALLWRDLALPLPARHPWKFMLFLNSLPFLEITIFAPNETIFAYNPVYFIKILFKFKPFEFHN